MPNRFLRSLQALELDERILNGAVIVSLVSFFLPWAGGEWISGATVSYNGFSSYTSIMGMAAFLLQLGILLITLVPLAGGPVLIRKRYREFVRLCLASEALILLLGILSVLTLVTVDFPRMEVRYGVYVCLVSTLVALFEASVRYIQQRKANSQEIFRHPEDPHVVSSESHPHVPPPPPPPPPRPPKAEDHPLYP